MNEQYLMYPHQIKPKRMEAFLKKYPQVEKSMKPFLSTRLMQGYKKWLNWKGKNEDKLGGTPNTVDSPSFGSKTFYKHDWSIAGIDSWAAVFQYLFAKQFNDPSLYSSKNESVNEASDKPMMAKSGNDILVDTTFVQLSNKFGKLDHIYMGDFSLKTKDGDVEFNRVNKQIKGFSGRTHKLTGDSKAITTLLKNMKPKVVKESVNEGVNWKEFYTMAKDTSGHNPSFEKKYGKLLDVPHIKDAITNTKDFNSFMRHVKKFESINEALWPKSKLSSRFQFVLAPELKKKFKGIFYVDGYDLYHNNKMIMKINPDKDSVNSIVNHISRNRSIQKNESVNESKNDYVGSHSGVVITLKNGHKHYSEDKLYKLYDKLGNMTKGLKVKNIQLVFENKNESVNEASRRATDFFGDSKYGKAIHQLLKGKWDTKKVKLFLDKLGGGNDVKYVRIMDFIAGDLGLNVRKYKTVGEMEPEMVKSMETLYKDFLNEGVVDDQGMQRVGTALPQTKEDDVELTESTEPKIITQLRDVMKSGYKKLKDPKSGKTMTVDSYSASAIVQVYDALKDPKNKEKFSSMGLLGMQSTAFKLIK